MLWKIDHLINRVKAMEYQVDMMNMMEVEEMCRQTDDAEPLSLEDSSVEDSSDSADEDERRMYFLNQTERRIVDRLRRKEALARQAKATCPIEGAASPVPAFRTSQGQPSTCQAGPSTPKRRLTETISDSD